MLSHQLKENTVKFVLYTFVSGSFSKGKGRGFMSSFGVSGTAGFTSGVGGCNPGVEGAGMFGVAGVPEHKTVKIMSQMLSISNVVKVH